MSNDHIKSEISAYLAGGLTETRNRQIESHTADCEKCRQALLKARGKQARQRREALKKASSDPLPNLFLARQGKEMGVDQPASPMPWVFAGLLLLTGFIYVFVRHYAAGPHSSSPPPGLEAGQVAVSSATSVRSVPISTGTAVHTGDPAPAPPKNPGTIEPQQVWKGTDGGIKNLRLVVIRNEESWGKLWTEMQETEPRPSVNFARHVVVGVFAGESGGGATITLGRITERKDDVLIPYHVTNVPAADSNAPGLSHPYLLTLLPRVDKEIRLTEREALP